MNFISRDPSGTLAGALAAQIDANGYAVIEDYVEPDELRGAQAFVADAIAANDGEYVGFTGTQRLGGTFLAGLPEDPDFVALCRGIYARAVGKPAPEVGFYQILRCLSGRGARAHSMRFHYDSYVLTALIPIVVPERGSPGRLIILPSTRLYFFWGYRSLHTNEPCDADAIRATALLHYADPHADSRVKRALRRR